MCYPPVKEAARSWVFSFVCGGGGNTERKVLAVVCGGKKNLHFGFHGNTCMHVVGVFSWDFFGAVLGNLPFVRLARCGRMVRGTEMLGVVLIGKKKEFRVSLGRPHPE